MNDTNLQLLHELADRKAIENVLGLYCRAIDRLDLDLLRSIYHADGVDDHGAFALPAHEFADKIIATLREVCVYSMHTVTHSVIELHGDSAYSEAYYYGFHTIAGGEAKVETFFGPQYVAAHKAAGTLADAHEYICGGRYLDVFAKRDGAWKILRRKITNEWGVCQPHSNAREGMPAAFLTPGFRDRRDPVYALGHD